MTRTALTALAGVLAMSACSAAAEDFDARWIGNTLNAREPDRRPEPRAYRRRSHTHVARRAHVREVVRVVAARDENEPAVTRATCMASISAISQERLTAENAWEDARRTWMNAVRWAYGERFMAIVHAESITRLCNISAASQNVTGRIGEAVRDAIGTEAGGNRWRCEISARPCMAPREAAEAKE